MDASDPMSSPSDPGKGDEAAAVVVTATTPTPAPISEHSPAAPPPAAPSSSESITKPTSPALPPTTPAPPVQPPRCLGARGYDGGFYDVGSFFVFRHGPQPPQVVTQDEAPASAEGAAASGGDLVELFGAGPSSAPSRKTAAAAAAATAPSPLQFVLLDGLSLRGACSGKGELEGDGKETAARAFVVLQRQVRVVQRQQWNLLGRGRNGYIHFRMLFEWIFSFLYPLLSPSSTLFPPGEVYPSNLQHTACGYVPSAVPRNVCGCSMPALKSACAQSMASSSMCIRRAIDHSSVLVGCHRLDTFTFECIQRPEHHQQQRQ